MKRQSLHDYLRCRAINLFRGPSAFSLMEVCVAAVILAIIGAQMYKLSDVGRQNFVLTKNYLEADKKLYSEIAFARQAAQQYTWCDVLYGVDMDATTFLRNQVVYSASSLTKRSFCADNYYLASPVSLYRPPLFLSVPGGDKCYAYKSSDLTNGVPSASAVPLEVGDLTKPLNSDDICTRSAGFEVNNYPDYKPWDLFFKKCRTDMDNNSYDPTGAITGQRLDSDPIVGNLVTQLVKHAEANNVMTKKYNNSRVDIKQTHRILLFYSIYYNLNTHNATDASTESQACAASTEPSTLSGCRSITRVVFIDAPVARWCS